MASVIPPTPSTKETTNYARLCRLLVDVGTCVLRDCFDSICTPPTLHKVLAANQPALNSLRSPRRIINATQWGKLFPAIPASVSSRDFDITLLMILFRNICGLVPPLTGWDALPAATDVSREADIARVKYFRNTVYAHAEHAFVDDATFNKHWKEIRDTLVRLGGVKYKVAVDNLEFCCMDPDMERHYKELLRQWKTDEDNITDELKNIGSDVKEMGTDVKQIGAEVKLLTKKLDDLGLTVTPCKEKHDEYNGPNLEEIPDSSLVCREKFHENEPLSLFCKRCKVCICNKCEQTRHNHHTTVDINQAAQEHIVDIEEIVEKMKSKIADYKERTERAKELLKRSSVGISAARNKVMTSVEELFRLLQEYEKTMVTALDVIEGKNQREHAVQQEHFEVSVIQLQRQVECCEGILQRKESVEILQSYHALIGRCGGLLNAEKLNSYKPSNVIYQVNEKQVDNFRGVVPNVGGIVFSNTDPLQSVVEGTGLQEGEVGRKAEFKVTTKNVDGDHCSNDEDQLSVKVKSPSGEELKHVIERGKDGEYILTYKPDCIGKHEVVIAINGEPLTGSPWLVDVAPHCYSCFGSFDAFETTPLKIRGPRNSLHSVAIDGNSGIIAVTYDENNVKLFHLVDRYIKQICTKKISKPTSLAFTMSGDLMVVASGEIFCLTEDRRKFLTHAANKHLENPKYLNIAHDGRMMVCDNSTIKVLSSDGLQLLLAISDPDVAVPRHSVCHQKMIFVSSSTTGNVKVFNEDGAFLYSIGTPEQLKFPVGLAVDMFNNLVVCDLPNSRLQIFTLDGKFLNTIEGENTRLESPYAIAASRSGQLLVSDLGKGCIHIFH